MNQESLFYEDIYDALRTTVMALGGAKKVGPMLWPDKTIDKARTALLNSISESRNENLRPEQIVFIGKKASEAGCHALAAYLNAEMGYAPPVPITPEDQRDEAMRQFSSAVKTVQDLAGRLEKLGVKVS